MWAELDMFMSNIYKYLLLIYLFNINININRNNMEEFDKNVYENDRKFLRSETRVMNKVRLCKNASANVNLKFVGILHTKVIQI